MKILYKRVARDVPALLIVALAVRGVEAQAPLTVERIFSGEFRVDGVGPSRWLDDSTYTVVEASGRGGGADLVKVDAATGKKTILIPASRLVPSAAKEPLEVEDYDWSADHKQLLIFTNS